LRGAIVFVVAFVAVLLITLGYSSLPPGQMIYDAVVGTEVDYEVLGIAATLLIIAVFNGVVYGVIIWLIYTLAERVGLIPKRRKPTSATSA
jgi:hypothetical protein